MVVTSDQMEKTIKIGDYTFSQDWFGKNTDNGAVWEEHLKELKGKEFSALEIGIFEGRSTLWLLDNILIHAKAKLVAVDPWSGYTEIDTAAIRKAYNRFLMNLDLCTNKNKLTVIHDKSVNAVKPMNREIFDLVYVDGSHDIAEAFADLVYAYDVAKPNGIVIVDDYLYGIMTKLLMDMFMIAYSKKITLMHIGKQAIYRKVAK